MIDNIFIKFDDAFAKNTVRAYRSYFAQYKNRCLQNKLDPIPASADFITTYVVYLGESNKSTTMFRIINNLGTILRLSKNYQSTKDLEVILALKHIYCKIGRAQDQTTPPTKSLLNQLIFEDRLKITNR